MNSTCSYLLLLLAALSVGCQKADVLPACQGSCTTITGRLITGQPQVGITGVEVTVKWVTSNGWNIKAIPKAHTTTDAQGNYRISFYIEDAELANGYFSVYYSVDKNSYYSFLEDQDDFYDLKRDTTYVVKPYVIPRKAFVHLVIINQNQLLVEKGYFTSDFNTCYGHNIVFSQAIQGGGASISWDGLPYENPLAVAGDQSILLTSYKNKDGVITRTADSLFIPAGTTRNISVTY
ncbi:hypothetical protein [Hymenobacter psoromatis]|uniref:hypothetical protein n=1 Tax=Hymenobacter psoromatis TaxID=1484116 RepID=UPI001CBE9F8B|nr:hypothetical protein [Hymenobacter psoromatis]